MTARRSIATGHCRHLHILSLQLLRSSLLPLAATYRPGNIVPMLCSGQYHGSRSVWFDVVGRHYPAFVVNHEAVGAEYGEGFETFRMDGPLKVDVDYLNERLQECFLQRIRLIQTR